MTKLLDESKYYNKLAARAQRRGRFMGQYEPVHDAIPGIVFSIGGSIYVPGRGESYVYVHEFGMRASMMHAFKPPNVIVWDGAGVMMSRSPKPPYQLEIIDTHVSPYPRVVVTQTQITRTAVSVHGKNHQWPTEATKGNDVFSIYPPALAMLKSVADGSNLEVTVGPLTYIRGTTRQWFPTELVDLTSYLPASGMVKCVLLSLDIDIGTITVTSGATFDDPFGTYQPSKPDTPSGNIPSGYFYLRGGATTLSMINDYVDARLWLASSVGSISAQQLSHVEAEFDYQLSRHVVSHPTRRGKLNIPTHVDTTWYTILAINTDVDQTKAIDIIVSGHSDDAATASWMYQFPAWVRNDGGIVTAGMGTVDNVTEYDGAYDAQAIASSGMLIIQVRRNGGSTHSINWAVTAIIAAYERY